MARHYIQHPDGRVVNAKPRKKPKPSSKLPKKDGYYWTRDVHPDDPNIVTDWSVCCVSHNEDGTVYITTAGFYCAAGRTLESAKSTHREFYPVRIKEPLE